MMGERIKKLRKTLGMTQAEFAKKIGSVQNTLTGYESGRRNPSNAVIVSICNIFGVSEEWLREGTGEMFLPEPGNEVEEIAQAHGLGRKYAILMKRLLELPEETQDAVMRLILQVANDVAAMEEEEPEPEPVDEGDPEIEAQVKAFREALEREKRASQNGSPPKVDAG